MIQAVQWLLYTRTEDPLPPQEILKQWDQAGQPKTRVLPPKQPKPPQPTGPKQYDHHTTAEEGLWARKGWAGHWKP